MSIWPSLNTCTGSQQMKLWLFLQDWWDGSKSQTICFACVSPRFNLQHHMTPSTQQGWTKTKTQMLKEAGTGELFIKKKIFLLKRLGSFCFVLIAGQGRGVHPTLSGLLLALLLVLVFWSIHCGAQELFQGTTENSGIKPRSATWEASTLLAVLSGFLLLAGLGELYRTPGIKSQ